MARPSDPLEQAQIAYYESMTQIVQRVVPLIQPGQRLLILLADLLRELLNVQLYNDHIQTNQARRAALNAAAQWLTQQQGGVPPWAQNLVAEVDGLKTTMEVILQELKVIEGKVGQRRAVALNPMVTPVSKKQGR